MKVIIYRLCLSKVFEAVIAWVKKDLVERSVFIEELLRNVRLPLLAPQFLADHVAQEEIVKNSLRCRQVVLTSYSLIHLFTLNRNCHFNWVATVLMFDGIFTVELNHFWS